jgi:hypothetical protein
VGGGSGQVRGLHACIEGGEGVWRDRWETTSGQRVWWGTGLGCLGYYFGRAPGGAWSLRDEHTVQLHRESAFVKKSSDTHSHSRLSHSILSLRTATPNIWCRRSASGVNIVGTVYRMDLEVLKLLRKYRQIGPDTRTGNVGA